MGFVDQTGLQRAFTKVKALADTKVNKSGDTMEGRLTAPEVAATSYFVTPTMVGEGDTSTYYHRVDFGHAGRNNVDFYEYGGTWNFYQNQGGKLESSVLVGSIRPDGFHGNVVGNASSATTVPPLTNDDIDAAFTEVFG